MFLSGTYLETIHQLDNLVKDCMDIQSIDASPLLLENKFLNSNKGKMYFITETTGVITLKEIILGFTDVEPIDSFENIEGVLMSGNAVLVLETSEEQTVGQRQCRALKVKANGYPGLSIGEAKDEQVLRGSSEGFSESYKTNEVLIRKRIRSYELKIWETNVGVRSKTGLALVYMDSIVRKEVLQDIQKRLEQFQIDGVTDSGMIEQLTDNEVWSPFPKYMTTTRPDRAAQFLLNGQIIVLLDNSPVALVLPVNAWTFLKTADDYYEKYAVATFNRILRMIAVFFSVSLPALYVAIVNFHPEILPSSLVNVFIKGRQEIPYPVFIEVMLMEISFELIREAGVRVPGTMGNAMGLVGGLIVGQAVVEANLASPIIVVITAITAMCSFAVPNIEFASALRLVKYFLIIMSEIFGIFGYLTGILLIFINLSKIDSFGFPYLGPLAAEELNEEKVKKDFIFRAPFKYLTKRTTFGNPENRQKLRFGEDKK